MQKVYGVIPALAVALAVFLTASCASMPKVQREAASEQIDLSGNWNDTDSQLVAQAMVSDSLSRPWLNDYIAAHGKKPRVIVGTVLNKSMEHINTDTFISDLERELTNSGRVIFVASRGQREEVRAERADQARNASMATAKSAGQEIGADFMLQGQINTIMDEAGGTSLKYYQVDLELVNMETNEKVWIGQKKIKKLVERSRYKF